MVAVVTFKLACCAHHMVALLEDALSLSTRLLIRVYFAPLAWWWVTRHACTNTGAPNRTKSSTPSLRAFDCSQFAWVAWRIVVRDLWGKCLADRVKEASFSMV